MKRLMHRELRQLIALAAVLTVSACAGRHEEVHPAPSGDVRAVAVFEMHQGQGGSFLRDLFLQSADGERVHVLTSTSRDHLAVVGWTDDTTLRLCADRELASASSVRTQDHEIRMEWNCEKLS